jgi:hypothetical protein
MADVTITLGGYGSGPWDAADGWGETVQNFTGTTGLGTATTTANALVTVTGVEVQQLLGDITLPLLLIR